MLNMERSTKGNLIVSFIKEFLPIAIIASILFQTIELIFSIEISFTNYIHIFSISILIFVMSAGKMESYNKNNKYFWIFVIFPIIILLVAKPSINLLSIPLGIFSSIVFLLVLYCINNEQNQI